MKKDLPKILKSKTPKVYKNKKLNNANFGDFTLNDYQVFLHLVSKIGGVDEQGKYLQPEKLEREHILTAKDFNNVFGVDLPTCYGILKKATDKLINTNIRIDKSDGSGFSRINVCSKADYNKRQGSITIKFTDDIMPYLSQVKQKFILYNLKEIANFGSLYTTRFYELIQEFQETGWMLKSVQQLRELFNIGDKFKLYGHFKKNTFGHACQEINDNYDMGLNFEEIKEGRRVIAVKFSFKKTIVYEAINQKTGMKKNIYQKPSPKNENSLKTGVKGVKKLIASVANLLSSK